MTYPYLGDFPTGKTIFVPFNTFNSAGASVTITGLAVTDIEVFKGASMTQRSSDAGYALVDTDGIDLDTITGIHGFTIDTSDNTDAGFYAAENDYTVVVSSITADSQTLNFIAARFSIDNRGILRPTTATRTLDVASTGEAGLDFGNVTIPVGANDALGWLENGTMQAGSGAGTAILRSATSLADDLVIGSTIYIRSGTGAGQSRDVYDWVSATDTASVSPNWITTPDVTSVYCVVPTPPAPTNSAAIPAVNTTFWNGTAVATPATAGIPDVNVKNIDNDAASASGTVTFPNATLASTTNITAGTVTTATNVTTVNGLAANVITAAATATDFGTEIFNAVLTTQLTQSYAADGTAPTLAQAVLLIQQSIGDFSVSGTTLTVKQLDGSTTAAVYSLDSATAPTSRTRTS